MSATTATAREVPQAERSLEQMKRAALAGIGAATPKVKDALHAGANALEANAEQCGEFFADVAECCIARKDAPDSHPDLSDSHPDLREPVSKFCTALVTDAVQAGRPHIDPAVDRTAACTSRVAERGIDCAADSADSCRQGASDLCGRVLS